MTSYKHVFKTRAVVKHGVRTPVTSVFCFHNTAVFTLFVLAFCIHIPTFSIAVVVRTSPFSAPSVRRQSKLFSKERKSQLGWRMRACLKCIHVTNRYNVVLACSCNRRCQCAYLFHWMYLICVDIHEHLRTSILY